VRFEELEAEGATLFPGAVEAVRRIAVSVPIAIASGARREEILRVLDAAGLFDLFVAIVAAEDVPHSKPNPAPYLLAVSLLADAAGGDRLQPSECVAIEDSHWGLESARVAGLRTVALSHTYKPSELGAADLVVESLDALDVETLSRCFT
jgi:beta-phosphoglucomutase